METVPFEEFQKLDLRIGKVINAERLQRTKKLLLLKVDIGRETINLVAGLAEHYKPEELIGKHIVVVANLEPKFIAGFRSEGMLLAAVLDNRPVLIVPEREVPPGTKIS
ncbi:MAG: methionine--tRNA ligase subunit beta [Thermofilaceae archaeon]